MNIALDVMGGDYAPRESIAGAILAARQFDVTVSLVGRPDVIERELAQHSTHALDLPIVPAFEVIEMSDQPAKAVRAKKDSSMVVACKLVKEGKADAFVTAGNTGGAVAAGILHFGRISSKLTAARNVWLSHEPGHRDCVKEALAQVSSAGSKQKSKCGPKQVSIA